jgi:hypothetical protein
MWQRKPGYRIGGRRAGRFLGGFGWSPARTWCRRGLRTLTVRKLPAESPDEVQHGETHGKVKNENGTSGGDLTAVEHGIASNRTREVDFRSPGQTEGGANRTAEKPIELGKALPVKVLPGEQRRADAGTSTRLFEQTERQVAALDHFAGNLEVADALAVGQVVHQVEHQLF